MDVVGRLRLDIVRRGLDTEILINNCGTIDLCDIGPNIVVYPDNIILRGVTVKDIPEIIEYLRGGPLVERLVIGPHAPEEQQRKLVYADAIASADPMESGAFVTLVESHGFDANWIAEQQRRGFIARKPTPEGDRETITVTKKARARYSL
jgi:(2Fe-2S) ferredoxin